MSTLTFDELRIANIERAKFYPKVIDHKRWVNYLMAEVGEYLQDLNDYEEGNLTFQEFRGKARSELPDIQTYLDLMAANLFIDLGAATIDKFNEVSNRIEGCNVYL
jgi:NTP pyrophosphatase (non-canonical NTP hydrolase)